MGWYLVPSRSGCSASTGGSSILSLWLWRLMIWVMGVSSPPFSTHPSPSYFFPPHLCLPPSLSDSSISHSTTPPPTLMFLLLDIPLLYLRRSAVAMHRRWVPVHPAAGHRRHPYVHRGVSLWQCHWWPQAQCLRCHIHRALRWESAHNLWCQLCFFSAV